MRRIDNPEGVCKLCRTHGSLCITHIYPRYAYKESGLTGDKKKFDVICYTDPSKTYRNVQSGLWEYMLCKACEGKINKWETYAKQVLFGKTPAVQVGSHFVLKNLDYTKLKLFTTSILWRAGVSTLDFFGTVNLGANHEEYMRQMLLNANPREPWRYACIHSVLDYNGKPINAGFNQPQSFKSQSGAICYRFLFCGVLWNIYVNETPKDLMMMKCALQMNGDWVIFRGELMDHPDLRKDIELKRQHSN